MQAIDMLITQLQPREELQLTIRRVRAPGPRGPGLASLKPADEAIDTTGEAVAELIRLPLQQRRTG